VIILGCCKALLSMIVRHGGPADSVVCQGCRRRWSWDDGAWWPGPVEPEEKEA